jgi:DNA invertase Pin-like site-specific DNA recombinase
MKAAIYCRVSTEEQDADKQEDICLEYCKRNNLEVYRVYKDVISGTTSSRPSFNNLLEDMRQRKFQVVLVTKLDRLGRSLQHLLSLLEEFNSKGIHFIAATQNIDTTSASGKLQLQILGAFAEFERNMISERTKEGLRKAIGVGKRGRDKNPRKRRGGAKNTLFTIENK